MKMKGEDYQTDDFDPNPKNGVYLLGIKPVFEGYLVIGNVGEQTHVDKIRVNGNYLGAKGEFETECDNFEIDDGVLNLIYTTERE